MVALLLGGAVGAWIAYRFARRGRRDLERTLARRELALLDARGDSVLPTLERADRAGAEGDAVLSISLQQLDEARVRADGLHAALEAQERHHALALAKLKVSLVRARKETRRATEAQQVAAATVVAQVTGRVADRRSNTQSFVRDRHERRGSVQERRISGHDRRARHIQAVPDVPVRDATPLRSVPRENPPKASLVAAPRLARVQAR